MSDDISDTLAPNSQQLDAVDLLGGPQTFTITEVKKVGGEQPVVIHLAEFPRPWKPGKNQRRVLAKCWGSKTSEWPANARVTLFCDTSVMFGGKKVGGIRISHMSHLDGPKDVPIIVTKGKSDVYTVQPLKEDPNAARIASLRNEWTTADPERRKAIEAEVAALGGAS